MAMNSVEEPMAEWERQLLIDADARHPKWQRIEPGTVIPAGQPYRAEFVQDCSTSAVRITETASESVRDRAMTVPSNSGMTWFVDSSWKPPLVLPTEPTWGIAFITGRHPTLGKWLIKKDLSGYEWFADVQQGQMQTALNGVLDFIPLTDDQVARIEAAR